MRRLLRMLGLFVLVGILLPTLTGALVGYARGWPANWREAGWGSSALLANASAEPEARVMVLAARTGRWKGIFAEHTWIVLKPAHAKAWTRYDVVGWGLPVRRDAYVADAFWYGNAPYVVYDRQGDEAARLIPAIEQAIARYPYASRGDYTVWPGPNSNSFVAWVVRAVPGFDTELPAVAIGKDYLGPGLSIGEAPSATGYVLSYAGLVGVTLALEEGLEIQIAGTSIGIDPNDLAIKLPALGKLGLLAAMR